jgi:hypothetical protein
MECVMFNYYRWFICFFICAGTVSMDGGVTKDIVSLVSQISQQHPFSYDLGIKVIPSKQAHAGITICCHGYGHSNKIINVVHAAQVIPDHLIGFNFPDYNITGATDHAKSTFGSINEILPLLYIIKRCVHDLELSEINLYGFSAGGGAIINALAVLNQSTYDAQLMDIGITAALKKQMLEAIERGLIILDCPLKSVEEILAHRGKSPGLEILMIRYAQNNMRPIDAIDALHGLRLTILLHFQQPDEILGNHDDVLFIERLRHANAGNTMVVIGSEGGHNVFHASLWQRYREFKNLQDTLQ